MRLGDNFLPGSDNEVITLERLNMCYRISSKASNVDSLNMDYRTFTLDFGDHFSRWDVPPMAVIYATSFENSFGAENQEFYHGKPQIAQVVLNHHTTMSFKMKRTELLKEKHTDCNEETYYEVIEKKLYSKIFENCTNPCYPKILPGENLPFCQFDDGGDYATEENDDHEGGYGDDYHCAYGVYNEIVDAEGDFYNYKSCSFEEYEGRFSDTMLIPGKPVFWYWKESDKQDWELIMPWESDFQTNPGNLTIKFSYTFESPSTMTVEVENYIVTFFDLMGIVGGTLGLFIGFAFYDNIIKSVNYLIIIVNWVKRSMHMRKASKVSNVKMSSKEEGPTEDAPKEVTPAKEESPKEESQKEESQKEDAQEEEIPKEEVPKEEVSKEETPEEVIPKQESTKEPQIQA